MKAALPENEAERLASLRAYRILDSLPEEDYDSLTAIAAHICGAPVSLISLVDQDRQWFKSRRGLPAGMEETHRDLAFCSHTILDPGKPLVVKDARQDGRFTDNDLVTGDPNFVFYAGVPLVTRDGYALGSLCVLDFEPRELSDSQLDALAGLANQVIRLFELRQSLVQSQERLRERESANILLRDFSHVIAHDLKAPVRNIRQASELLLEDFSAELPEDGKVLVAMIMERATAAANMIEGVLRYSQASGSLTQERAQVDVAGIIQLAVQQLGIEEMGMVEYRGAVRNVFTSEIALLQIFQNLIGNAHKFCDHPDCRVVIDCEPCDGDTLRFSVIDNGPGIPAHHLSAVFNLFHSVEAEGRDSHGVGLSIVKRLVEVLGGTVEVASDYGRGATFSFTLPRHTGAYA